jgi:hypothetical protein
MQGLLRRRTGKIIRLRQMTQTRRRRPGTVDAMDPNARIRPGIVAVARAALLFGVAVYLMTSDAPALTWTVPLGVALWLRRRRRSRR